MRHPPSQGAMQWPATACATPQLLGPRAWEAFPSAKHVGAWLGSWHPSNNLGHWYYVLLVHTVQCTSTVMYGDVLHYDGTLLLYNIIVHYYRTAHSTMYLYLYDMMYCTVLYCTNSYFMLTKRGDYQTTTRGQLVKSNNKHLPSHMWRTHAPRPVPPPPVPRVGSQAGRCARVCHHRPAA